MSNSIHIFLSNELTCLPEFFDKYISKHYNNTLGNALFWAFSLWYFIHFFFQRCIKALLRQMKYPEYVRNRMVSTLWHFGFCLGSVMFCFTMLLKTNFSFTLFYKLHLVKSTEYVPSQHVLGFVILSTFYAQTAFSNWSEAGPLESTINYVTLLLLSTLTYIYGWMELLFALVCVISLVQCTLEIGRIFSFQMYHKNLMLNISKYCFYVHIFFCILLYFVVAPLYFLIPCGKNFTVDIVLSTLLLNACLWTWFLLSIINSALFKAVKHYVHHMTDAGVTCRLSFIDCCMFPPRTDTAYNLKIVRKQIEIRKENSILKRKQPNRAVLYQTLKCVTAVKRKLEQKRAENSLQKSVSNIDKIDPTITSMSMYDDLEADEQMTDSTAVVHQLLNDLLEIVKKKTGG